MQRHTEIKIIIVIKKILLISIPSPVTSDHDHVKVHIKKSIWEEHQKLSNVYFSRQQEIREK